MRVQNSDALVQTYRGSRPGDVFGDILFNFLVAKIGQRVNAALEREDLETTIAWSGDRTLDLPDEGGIATHDIQLPKISFVDDLALIVMARAQHLVPMSTRIAEIAVDKLAGHGLMCNSKSGKSEAMLVFGGQGCKDVEGTFRQLA